MDVEKMKEEAVAARLCGFNCAQGVLSACGEYTGLDRNTALAVSGPMGGGAGYGELCGAVTGALMAVGMAIPFIDNTRPELKAASTKRARAVCAAFDEKYGCVRCRELKAKRIDCSELIAFGVETAAKVIEENK